MNKNIGNPIVAVDVVVFIVDDSNCEPNNSSALKILLTKRDHAPFKNYWALPGGFLKNNELAMAAAGRLLKEKAGVAGSVNDIYLEQLYTFDDLRRDPRGRVITVAYFALASESKIKLDPKNYELPGLYAVNNLPKLAFDHQKIVKYALKRLQAKVEYTNVVFSLLPRYFTLSQLQNIYEVIFGKRIDKRNFRKKFLSLSLIRPTKNILRGARQRPTRLYEFIAKKPVELKKFL